MDLYLTYKINDGDDDAFRVLYLTSKFDTVPVKSNQNTGKKSIKIL